MRFSKKAGFILILVLSIVMVVAQARSHHSHQPAQAVPNESSQSAVREAVVGDQIQIAQLPPEGRDTLQLIQRGGPFPYPRDGVVFSNFERKLPELARGCTSDTLLTKSADCGRRCEAGAHAPKGSAPPCRARYHEYTVKTPGISHRGARRIVCGEVPECYYTADHYKSFKRIVEAR